MVGLVSFIENCRVNMTLSVRLGMAVQWTLSSEDDFVSKADKACIVDIVSFIENCRVTVTLSVRLIKPV